MKKIFAIALALVMVLSMASAFASYCTAGFDWTCATSDTFCGQGTVELVPYVKVNNGCGGYDWQVSECASAVSSEKVFYAIKLTVDANADEAWWKQAKVELTYKGMAAAAPAVDKPWSDVKAAIKAEDTADEVNVFYYNFATTAWDIVNDDFVLANKENTHVKAEKVGLKAADAKICVELKSASKGTAGIVGEYYVVYTKAGKVEVEGTEYVFDAAWLLNNGIINKAQYNLYNTKGTDTKITALNQTSGKNDKAKMADYDNDPATAATYASEALYVEVVNLVTALIEEYKAEFDAGYTYETPETLVVYTKDPAKGGKALVTYTIVDGKVRTIKNTPVCGEAEYATIKAFFGLEIGTCVDADLIAANFGWDFKQKDCFEWSDKAASIVDAECVVAIPKTGDASVLAWLF